MLGRVDEHVNKNEIKAKLCAEMKVKEGEYLAHSRTALISFNGVMDGCVSQNIRFHNCCLSMLVMIC